MLDFRRLIFLRIQRCTTVLVAAEERDGGQKCSDSISTLSSAVSSCGVYHNLDFKPKKACCIVFPSYISNQGAGTYINEASLFILIQQYTDSVNHLCLHLAFNLSVICRRTHP